MNNKSDAVVEGFVTQDPVLKKTKSGKSVCDYSIAVRHYINESGEANVSFIDIESWEKLAEITSENVKKGSKVIVFGVLKQNRWEGEDGKVKSRVKVVAKDLRYFDKKTDDKKEEKVELSA